MCMFSITQLSFSFVFSHLKSQLTKHVMCHKTGSQSYITHMARSVTSPQFQLIQIFQQASRAICHGQCPGELVAGCFTHLRLHFSLSHEGECVLLLLLLFRSVQIRVNTTSDQHTLRCPADCSSTDYSCAPGKTFPNMGCHFLHLLLVEVSRGDQIRGSQREVRGP